MYEPKFHLARHVSTRHVRRFERVVTSVSSPTCSNMTDDEKAVVLACTSLVFCALDLRQSQEHVHPSPRCGDAPNTCRAFRSCRACRVTSVSRRALRHARHVSSLPSQVEFGLYSVRNTDNSPVRCVFCLPICEQGVIPIHKRMKDRQKTLCS